MIKIRCLRKCLLKRGYLSKCNGIEGTTGDSIDPGLTKESSTSRNVGRSHQNLKEEQFMQSRQTGIEQLSLVKGHAQPQGGSQENKCTDLTFRLYFPAGSQRGQTQLEARGQGILGNSLPRKQQDRRGSGREMKIVGPYVILHFLILSIDAVSCALHVFRCFIIS